MFWNDQRDAAFRLSMTGDLTIEEIAQDEQVLCVPKTVYNWRQTEEWKARAAEHAEILRDEAVRLGIATRERRLTELRKRHQALLRIVAQRAADPKHKDVPEYATGYIVCVGDGKYKFDEALSRELRRIEQQMAVELGQWQSKAEGNGLDIEAAAKKTRDAGAAYIDPDADEGKP